MLFVISVVLLVIWAARQGSNGSRAPTVSPGPSRMVNWIDASGQRVTPDRVREWVERRGAAMVSPLEERVYAMFQTEGYVDNILYTLRSTGGDPWQILERHWSWELDLQRSIAASVQVARARERTLPSQVMERVTWVAQHPALAATADFHDAVLQHGKVVKEAEATLAADALAGPLHFQAHEPRWFRDAMQQPEATARLERLVRALQPPECLPTRHVLLTGPAGLGKTLYAKILTHELRQYNNANRQPLPELVEVFGSNVSSIADYDKIFRRIQTVGKPTVLFIDEIHTLDPRMGTKLYGLLTDGVYAFQGEFNPVLLPPVFVIAATTDYGDMHAALKRRFGEPVHLKPLGVPELAALARNRKTPVAADAVDLLVDVTRWSGAPWELLSLLGEAELVQRAERATSVTVAHVRTVFTALALDNMGLRAIDRTVLSVLFRSPKYTAGTFTCFALSQADVCAQARIDPGEFATVIKARLQGRSLVTTRSGAGQTLTTAAYTFYRDLCPPEYHHLLPRR